VHKRDHRSPAPATVIPDLAPVVPADQLPDLPAELNAHRFDPTTTGSTRLWDDYTPGTRINHPAGMTVDNSDHTLATKLYQNNAKVHFDDLAMQATPFKQRLMYGGHVMSVCRALSYDGLENALMISAINAGTHVNPTFGGDTLYCWSEVLEQWALPGRDDLGALRLRLVGLKNLNPASLPSAENEIDGKRRYHPNIVLDLDYTVLMPRRRH
ncbi:MAG: MaoC family dehydratase, partial [Natronospirillum sp.]